MLGMIIPFIIMLFIVLLSSITGAILSNFVPDANASNQIQTKVDFNSIFGNAKTSIQRINALKKEVFRLTNENEALRIQVDNAKSNTNNTMAETYRQLKFFQDKSLSLEIELMNTKAKLEAISSSNLDKDNEIKRLNDKLNPIELIKRCTKDWYSLNKPTNVNYFDYNKKETDKCIENG